MPFYLHLKEIFGKGTFYESKKENSNTFTYTIGDKDNIVKIINLVNGKFRTPKIEYLYKAIDYMNNIHGTNIEKLPIDNSNLLSNP
jgi:hypothetical protein